jgi:signal transduction histidine kinase
VLLKRAVMLNIINNIVSISKIESGQMNLSYRETSNQMESLYNTFKTEAEQKNIKLKINNTLSEIDNFTY